MRRSFIIAISFFISLFLIVFLIWPKYQALKPLQLQIEQKKLELQYQKEKIQFLKDLSRKLEDYKSQLSKIDLALPQNPSLPALFHFLFQKVFEGGLIFDKISSYAISPLRVDFGENQIFEGHQIIVEFEASGSYSNFKNLLSLLEKSARLIEVEKISLSAQPKKDDFFTFSFSIKTHSY